jgi:hypothetical protein
MSMGDFLLLEVDHLETVLWNELTHAYGDAFDVPNDIRRLASSDPKVREQAHWQLSGSIFHQGTIYSATAAALPFLLRLASDQRLPDRARVCGLLEAIAASSAVDSQNIQKAWAWRRKHLGEVFAKPTEEMAAEETAIRAAVLAGFLEEMETVRRLSTDADAEVAGLGKSILGRLGQGE